MSDISLFDNIKTSTQPTKLSLDSFLKYIKDGKWGDRVNDVREALKKASTSDEKGKIKGSLPNATISGYFDKRGNNHLVSHSGFILIDIDDLGDSINDTIKVLRDDPYTYALFKSVSGNGLGVVIKIDPEKHLQSFKSLEHYYSFNYNLRVDPACKDVARTRFVSHDPDTYINKKALEFDLLINDEGKSVKKYNDIKGDVLKKEAERAVKFLEDNTINITDGYENWFTVAMALATSLKEDGRDLFHRISALSPQYDSVLCGQKYDNCLNSGTGSITIGSFFHMLKDHGFTPDSRGMNRNNNLLTVIDQINAGFEIRYNEISNVIESRQRGTDAQFDALDFDSLYIDLKAGGFSIVKEDLKSLVRSDRIAVRYNPIREYFEGLNWDGNSHIDELSAYFKTDNDERWAVQFKKMLVRSIACALEEDTFNKHCLVLHSTAQNLGKTTFWRWLCPEPFRRRYYFEGNIDPQNKDSMMYLSSSFFINLDELASVGKAGINHLKAMLTMNGTNIRLPFAPQVSWVSRIANFVGSTNDDDFLTDISNVRWVVIMVDDIDFDYSKEINLNQVWAEAYELYRDGYDYNLTREEIADNEEVANRYKSTNVEQDLIRKYFKPSSSDDNGIFVRNSDIIGMLQELNPSIRVSTRYISNEAKRAGLRKVTKRGVNGYWVELTEDYHEDKGNISGLFSDRVEKSSQTKNPLVSKLPF